MAKEKDEAEILFKDIKKNAGLSGQVDPGELMTGFSKELKNTIGKLTVDISEKTLKLGPEIMKALETGTVAGFKNISGVVLSTLVNSAKEGGAGAIAMLSLVFDTMVMGFISMNNLWKGMFQGVAGSINSLTKFAVSIATGGQKSAVGKAITGYMDNIVAAALFLYGESLEIKKAKYRAEGQTGAGSDKAVSATNEIMSKRSQLGIKDASEWSSALSAIGVVGETKVFPNLLRISLQTQMSTSETATMANAFIGLAENSLTATTKMEETFRKLQSGAQGTSLSVKDMAKWVQEAGVQARFLNVDVRILGNMMSNLAKDSQDSSKFGINMRAQGGEILKDLTGGAKKMMEDGMHMFFGSNMGTDNIGMKAWVKSKFGTTVADTLRESVGGGFTSGAGVEDALKGGGDMLANKLIMVKTMMLQASESGSDVSEKLLLQTNMAKEMLGVSDVTAVELARRTMDQIKQLPSEPEMMKEFKSEKDLMKDLITVETMSANIQRALAGIAMDSLVATLKGGVYLQALAIEKMGKKEDQDKARALMANMGSFSPLESMGKNINTILGQLGGIFSGAQIKLVKEFLSGLTDMTGKITFKPKEEKPKTSTQYEQHGGVHYLKDGGEFKAIVGETGREKITVTPGYDLNKPGGGGSGGNTHITMNITGLNADIIREVRTALTELGVSENIG